MVTILWSATAIFVSFYLLAILIDGSFLKSLDNIAYSLKLSPDVAGATLLAIGTSAPELAISMFALFLPNSNPATGLGNIVGSAIFQILVVIGFASLVKTSYLNWKPVMRDGVFYTFTIILLIVFVWDKQFTLFETSVLLITYVVYLGVLFSWHKIVPVDQGIDKDPIETVEKTVGKKSLANRGVKVLLYPLDALIGLIPDPEKNKKLTIPVFVLCLGIIAGLSYILVVSAEAFAIELKIPEAIVGLTILAGGSSIPELISSFVVSKQGRGDMAISNAIGSNIFDILVSLGLPLFLYTVFRGTLGNFGVENVTSSIVLLFVTMIAVVLLLVVQKFKADRKFGILLIAMYVIYVISAYSGWLEKIMVF